MKIHKITALLSFMIFSACGLALSACSPAKTDGAESPAQTSAALTRVYFLNQSANMVECEDRALEGDDNSAITGSALSAFMEGPRVKTKTLAKTYPDGLRYTDPKLVDNPDGSKYFQIEFSADYYAMTPLQELFFRSSFVWTMTELPFIDSVLFYVDGQKLANSKGTEVGLMNRENVILNPSVSPSRTQEKVFKLCFANADGTALAREERTLDVNPERDPALYVLEQLIAGPKEEGHNAVLPPEVKIVGVKTEDGICFVNLSGDFIGKVPPGLCAPKTTVYAIVNSIVELSGVKKVRFMVDSEPVTQYRGAVDLSRVFERDDAMFEGQ